jgi:hypothetical protein
MRTRWLDSTHGRLMQRLAADGYARPDVYSRFRDQVVRPRQQVTFDVLRRGAERGEIRSDFDPAWVSDMLTQSNHRRGAHPPPRGSPRPRPSSAWTW